MHGEARLAEVLEAGGGVAEHAQGGGAPARARDQVKQEQEVVACQQSVCWCWRAGKKPSRSLKFDNHGEGP